MRPGRKACGGLHLSTLLPLSSRHSFCLPQRLWEIGESSPIGDPSSSTSTFIPSQQPVLAVQEKIRGEKNTTKTRQGSSKGGKKEGQMHSPGSFFLSSDGHLDIYRDLVHNHFSICKCLLRLESRR